MTKIENLHDYNVDIEKRVIYLPQNSAESINPSAASSFCKNIDLLVGISDDPISIKFFSVEGGCWYSGMVMYEHIQNCPCEVTIYSFSLLCSMGTIILQAADNRYICPHMNFMVHFGSDEYSGNALAIKSYAEFQKNSHNKMIDIYADKCQYGDFFVEDYNLNKVKNYLRTKIKDRGDWWMTAEEVIKYGFADKIIERTW